MRNRRKLPGAALLALSALAVGNGCTHYHYYGAQPQLLCEPQPAVVSQRPVMVPYGSVCDVPPSARETSPQLLVKSPGQGDVLLSRPQGGTRRGSRFAWHRPSPETLATTRVEGGLDESTVR